MARGKRKLAEPQPLKLCLGKASAAEFTWGGTQGVRWVAYCWSGDRVDCRVSGSGPVLREASP